MCACLRFPVWDGPGDDDAAVANQTTHMPTLSEKVNPAVPTAAVERNPSTAAATAMGERGVADAGLRPHHAGTLQVAAFQRR